MAGVRVARRGAYVQAKTKPGSTALHWACHHNATTIVDVLLTAKADPTVNNLRGETPLHWGVRRAK